MGCQLTSLIKKRDVSHEEPQLTSFGSKISLTPSPNWPILGRKRLWRGPQLNFLWSKKYHWCKAPTDLLWSKHSLTTDHLDVLIWRFYETYYWKSCEADISKLGGAQWMASLQLAGPGWTRRGEWQRMFKGLSIYYVIQDGGGLPDLLQYY